MNEVGAALENTSGGHSRDSPQPEKTQTKTIITGGYTGHQWEMLELVEIHRGESPKGKAN